MKPRRTQRRIDKQRRIDEGRVLAWLREHPGLQAAGDIGRGIGIRRHERRALLALLADLADRGLVERHKGDRYRSSPRRRLSGVLALRPEGYGFLRVDGEEGVSVFLPARELSGAMDGDRLAVVAWRDGRGRWEGRLERILERARSEVVGVFHSGRREHLVVPQGRDALPPVVVPRGATRQARPGQVVVVAIRSYPERGRPARGEVVRVLGDADDPRVEVTATAIRFGLPYRFAPDVLAEAGKIPEQVSGTESAGRRDLRSLPFVTIDGLTAKDFDDAVQCERTGDGFLLRVAIADVAHYVRPGSLLDREARERGTSVYFPGSCIPMLPEKLSNGICSLNPDTDRLVMLAELVFDHEGHCRRTGFSPAVIRSVARLTYTEVQAHLDGKMLRRPGCDQLDDMAALARLLRQRRRRSGSLDLDLPEADIVLDLRGRPEAILRRERLFSHRIIEEFMLAANQAVAIFLEERGEPFPWRVHEPPAIDRLLELQHYLAHFGLGFDLGREGPEPSDFSELLQRAEDDAVLSRVVNQALLRAMKQARYSADNPGHFGLGMARYCHFTSPIRRYPDLLVHRALRRALGIDAGSSPRDLDGLCEQASRLERRAMEAERDVLQLKKCQYMARQIGAEHAGVVAMVRPFGLFVELDEIFVEGLVHVSRMEEDVYYFEEDLQRLVGYNRRRIFQIGDRVRVRVERVDVEGRRIDFVLVDGE